MVLSCINTNNYYLKYERGGLSPYARYVVTFESDGGNLYKNAGSGKVGDIITFEIEEDESQREYIAVGTYANVSPRGNGETRYFWHSWHNDIIRDYFNYETKSGLWSFTHRSNGLNKKPPRVSSSYVYDISKEKYDSNLRENSVSPWLSRDDYIFNPNTTSAPYFHSLAATNLNITKYCRFGTVNHHITFYKNGEYLSKGETRAYRTDRFNPDPELVEVNYREAIDYKVQVFTKEKNTQGVEILVDFDNPNKKKLWLVDLNEIGEEINRRSIFEWETLPSQRPPIGRITCQPATEIQECPDDTYQFDCGTHLCCYRPDGTAHSRIDN